VICELCRLKRLQNNIARHCMLPGSFPDNLDSELSRQWIGSAVELNYVNCVRCCESAIRWNCCSQFLENRWLFEHLELFVCFSTALSRLEFQGPNFKTSLVFKCFIGLWLLTCILMRLPSIRRICVLIFSTIRSKVNYQLPVWYYNLGYTFFCFWCALIFIRLYKCYSLIYCPRKLNRDTR